MRVFLVGPPGAGKSTVGRQLAAYLQATFFDLDEVIQERAGADIPWIFDVEGESGFRDRESAVVNDFASRDNVVIATGGGVLQDALFAESPPVLSLVTKLMPNFGLEQLAARSVSWWAMSPVLPDAHNRLTLRGNHLQIHYLPNNREAHDRLVYRWIDTLKKVENDPLCHVVKPSPTHPRGEAPLTVMGSVCGTCRMGSNPATSVVDLQGRSHELANLYIADASVFPSCPAVGMGLTVIANALRIGDGLVKSL